MCSTCRQHQIKLHAQPRASLLQYCRLIAAVRCNLQPFIHSSKQAKGYVMPLLQHFTDAFR
eukprot:CAMPEP_0119348506 /NCGR_PEP_ID=MMETSP1333-20130426/109080_1 /TAXON_ID=418940 /ORGANISM="Scyphosphaera apsteinii, Strain RCC1455" /LENGTH=60 /DNA_ID=CAMNT_0007361093 /DNA_START=1095 /DNA_END=1277 /DNA_ORIENTATION=+